MAKKIEQDSANGLVSRKTNEEIDTDNNGDLIISGESVDNYRHQNQQDESEDSIHLED